MRQRTPAQVALRNRQFGIDLALAYAGPGGWWEDADLVAERPPGFVASPVDIATKSGVDAAVQFLVDRHGLSRFRSLYETGDYAEVYGQPLSAIEREWRASLSR